jgi:hypothetical protein
MREWLILMIGVEWEGNGRHGFSAEATVEGGLHNVRRDSKVVDHGSRCLMGD